MMSILKSSFVYPLQASKGSLTNLIVRYVCAKSNSTQQPDASRTRGTIDSQRFCIDHVKKYDRENYLAALCIKDKFIRRFMFALRAFNVELALVRDSTTNTDRAKIRFHFWSKLVEEIVRRNDDKLNPNPEKLAAYYNYTPVAKELLVLFYLVDTDCDTKKRLSDLIGARVSSKVLGYKSFENLTDLELYCSKSNGSIYHLATNIARQTSKFNENSDQIRSMLSSLSETLGIAHGLSNIIRGIPYNATKNCCYIPADLLASNQLTIRDFSQRKLNGERISPMVKILANRCQNLVNELQVNVASVPMIANQILLPRVSIQAYLNKLRNCNYNVCHSSLSKQNDLLPMNLWLSSKFSRFPIW